MALQTVRAIASKELVDVLSEKVYWLAFFLEFMIVLGVILLGIAFAAVMNPGEVASNSPNMQVTMGLLDFGNSSSKDAILGCLRGENIRLLTAQSFSGLRESVQKGSLMGGIVLPEGYDEGGTGRLEVGLVVDESKLYASVITAKVESAVDQANAEVSGHRLDMLGLGNVTSFPVAASFIGKPAVPVDSADFVEAMYLMVVPLILVFPILLSANMTADSVVGEKETGTLGILMASPASRLDIVVGKILPVMALANLQFLAWLLLLENNALGSVKVFNKLPLLALLNLGALSFVGAGLLISAWSRSSKESNLYLTLLIASSVFPLFLGLPRMGALTSMLDGVFLVRVIGGLCSAPGIQLSSVAPQFLLLSALALGILAACVRSIGRLEPLPSG